MALAIPASKSGVGVQYSYAFNDDVYVVPNVVVASLDSYAVALQGTSNSIMVQGTLAGQSGVSVGVLPIGTGGAGGNRVIVQSTGSILGVQYGLNITTSGNVVRNYGVISSTDYVAVQFKSTSSAGTDRLYNFGTIEGESGINIAALATTRIVNYGSIIGTGTIPTAIFGAAGTEYIVNRGRIEGQLSLADGNDTVINRSLVTDNISLGAGIDLVDNRQGTIDGAIDLGSDNDTLIPGANSEVATGGAGIDVLDFTRSTGVTLALDGSLDPTGWALGDSYTLFENVYGSATGNDTLVGDSSPNLLLGLGGNDTLTGQMGADLLKGGTGSDTIDGGLDDDSLYGNEGNDVIIGGAGADALNGGAGNDTLTGGTGFDKLEGGSGADRFIFQAADITGTSTTAGQYDEVRDFLSGEADRIDLSAIDANVTVLGDQAFAFIGSAGFSKVAGQLRFEANPAGGVFVSGDTNGDGTADFTIGVLYVSSLAASDFAL